METFFIDNKEILIDNNRFYLLNGWNKEIYNGVVHTVPSINKEIKNPNLIRHIREQKLKRILKIK